MLKIKVPATTSNLGVGFDTLGMALNIYNSFTFEESETYNLLGFEPKNLVNNLVLQSYIDFCLHTGLNEKDIKKVTIEIVENSIPIARGLGSSATCIIAGVLAANQLNNLNKTDEECIVYCSNCEGHPDNVYSAFLGGFNATFKEDAKYINQELKVSENLYFTLLVPGCEGKTEVLRSVLPEKALISDAVYNLSRIIQLPAALESGNFEALKIILKDKLHEQYRSLYIPEFNTVKDIALENDMICLISGSGPTIFLISTKEVTNEFKSLSNTFTELKVKKSVGTRMEWV